MCASVLAVFLLAAFIFGSATRSTRWQDRGPALVVFGVRLWPKDKRWARPAPPTLARGPHEDRIQRSVPHVSPSIRPAAGVAEARVHLAQRLASTHCQTPGPCGCPATRERRYRLQSINPRRHRGVGTENNGRRPKVPPQDRRSIMGPHLQRRHRSRHGRPGRGEHTQWNCG